MGKIIMKPGQTLEEAFKASKTSCPTCAALLSRCEAAEAAKEKAEAALCRIRIATNETKGVVDNLWHKIDVILDLSAPCSHVEEAKRLCGIEANEKELLKCLKREGAFLLREALNISPADIRALVRACYDDAAKTAEEGHFQIGCTAIEAEGVVRRTRDCIAAAIRGKK